MADGEDEVHARQEFVIGGFTDQGDARGLGALVIGHYEGDGSSSPGRHGFTHEMRSICAAA
jgi:hypothetical protein